MLSRFVRMATVGLSLSAGACAIHPLPEDVTNVPTNLIVNKIRCEARTAVIDHQLPQLRDQITSMNNQIMMLENQIAALKAANQSSDKQQQALMTQKKAYNTLIKQYVDDIGIAYDFSFDMTETNNLDATLDLSKTMKRGTFTANVPGNFDRMRENIRIFQISDHFQDLLINLEDRDCSDLTSGANYLYPITGKIGVAEMIDTFYKLKAEHLTALPSAGGHSGPQKSVKADDTLTLTPQSLPAANRNALYIELITATGGTGPYNFAVSGFPSWLKKVPAAPEDNGLIIYGKLPRNDKGQSYVFTVRVTDSSSPVKRGEQIYEIQIAAGNGSNASTSDSPAMSDQIKFTTKFSATATPKIVLTTVGNALQLADGNIMATATRNDVHQVTVALAACPIPMPPPDRRAGYSKSTDYDTLSKQRASARIVSVLKPSLGAYYYLNPSAKTGQNCGQDSAMQALDVTRRRAYISVVPASP